MSHASHISFISVPVADFDRATAFYRDQLKMTVTVDAPMGNSRWVMLEIPGARTQLHLDDRADRIDPKGRPVLPLIVPDLAALLTALRAADIEIVQDAKPAEWDPSVDYALIRDTEGNLVMVSSG